MRDYISIIVPMYNSEEFIERCIQSVMAQTYTYFELILVNDGSSDGTLEICNNFHDRHNRIRIINRTTNGGVSSARNFGIKNARGKWICFMDSDDVIGEYYLENLMADDFDFVISGISIRNSEGVYTQSIKPKRKAINDKKDFAQFVKEINNYGFIINGPCQKRFRTNKLLDHNIYFDESLSYGEDTLFVFKYFFFCKSAISIEKIDYTYLVDSNNYSLSKNIDFDIRLSYVFKFLELIKEFIVLNRIDKNMTSTLNHIVQDQLVTTLGILYNGSYDYCNRKNNIVRVKTIISSKYEWFEMIIYSRRYYAIVKCYDTKCSYFFDLLSKLFFNLKRIRVLLK